MSGKEGEPHKSGFEFTHHEALFSQQIHRRFMTLLADPDTTIHRAEVTSNLYGEYLFVTVSRPTADQARMYLTFYGLGFHEQRERWITDVWSWYAAVSGSQTDDKVVDKAMVERLIADRQNEIGDSVTHPKQSKRAQFFEMLADLTDEDGAITEMEDLEALGCDFDVEDEELR
jgi:hypothetical protein